MRCTCMWRRVAGQGRGAPLFVLRAIMTDHFYDKWCQLCKRTAKTVCVHPNKHKHSNPADEQVKQTHSLQHAFKRCSVGGIA